MIGLLMIGFIKKHWKILLVAVFVTFLLVVYNAASITSKVLHLIVWSLIALAALVGGLMWGALFPLLGGLAMAFYIWEWAFGDPNSKLYKTLLYDKLPRKRSDFTIT